jgi:hypothetical protein
VAPDIAEIDTDRHLEPGLPAWDFCDEVLRWLLHGQQSLRSDLKNLLIPFVVTHREWPNAEWFEATFGSVLPIWLAAAAPRSDLLGKGW